MVGITQCKVFVCCCFSPPHLSILNIYLALLHTFYTVYLHDNNEQITKIIFRGNHCCKKPTGPRVPLEMCNPTIVTEKFGWLWT